MLVKDYWFKEFYLGLKVAASLDRTESFIKTIEGQVRCITAEFKQTGVNVASNVSHINVFIPGWFRQCTTASAVRKSNAATPGRPWKSNPYAQPSLKMRS